MDSFLSLGHGVYLNLGNVVHMKVDATVARLQLVNGQRFEIDAGTSSAKQREIAKDNLAALHKHLARLDAPGPVTAPVAAEPIAKHDPVLVENGKAKKAKEPVGA